MKTFLSLVICLTAVTFSWESGYISNSCTDGQSSSCVQRNPNNEPPRSQDGGSRFSEPVQTFLDL